MYLEKSLQITGQSLILRDMKTSHMEDLLALHRRIFNSDAQQDWFAWKYEHGHGDGVGIWNADQELIAFCGGVPRQFLQQGQAAGFLQIGDLMVSPEWRGIMVRKNPFWYACDHFYRTRLGKGNAFKVGFGFTHSRSHRLHIKQGLSWDGGSVQHLQWQTSPEANHGRLMWLWRTQALAHDAPHLRCILEKAWQAMRQEVGDYTIGVRDAAYCLWRFTQRPDKQYRLFALRRLWDRQPLGVLVMSQPSYPGEAAQWLDWIGPLRHMEQACLAALRIASQDGAAAMTAWASPAVAQWLEGTQPIILGSVAEIGILTPSDLDPDQASSLNIWLMAGDTDFI